MSRYDDILARLRAATGPDRDLDARIIVALAFGKQIRLGRKPGTITEHYYPGTWGTRTAQTVTSSIDSALALVEKNLPGWRIDLQRTYGHFSGWFCALKKWNGPEFDSITTNHTFWECAPIAILVALFEALKAKEE